MPQTKTKTKTIKPILVPTEPKHHVVVVTTDWLRDYLYARTGSAFISFTAKYDMDAKGKMLKGGRGNVPVNPFVGKGLVKLATTRGGVTFKYDEGVQRRLDKEGKDASDHKKGSSWSHAIVREDGTLTPLSVHAADINDDGSFKTLARTYLRFRQDSSESHYELPDGSIVEKSELQPWLSKPNNYKSQGLDNPLQFQTISFDSLVSLTIDGVTYFIERD